MTVNRNMIIVGVAVVVGIFATIAAGLLYNEVSRFTEAKERLNGSKGKLQRFYSMKPFPSSENVTKERDNVRMLVESAVKLTTDLKKGQIPLTDKTPATLLKQLDDTKKDLGVLAAERQTQLPANFNFGFDRYADGGLPLADHVRRLSEQLIVVETLTRLLLEEGVTNIVSVTREEFEGRDTGGVAPVSAAAPGPGRPGKPVQISLRDTDLFVKSRFSLDFSANELTVWKFLNKLAKHGVFMAVTSLELDAMDADGVHLPAREVKKDAAEDAEKKAPPVEDTPMAQDRVVSGKKFEQPMKVKLVLDEYRFKEAPAK